MLLCNCAVSPTSLHVQCHRYFGFLDGDCRHRPRAMGAPLAAPRMPLGGLGILSGQAFLMLLMTLIALAGLRRRRAWVLLAATLLFVAMLAACGSSALLAPPRTGRRLGPYTISVTGTAADGTTVSVPLTLIVN